MVRTHIRLCFLHLALVVFLDIRNVSLRFRIASKYELSRWAAMGDARRWAMGYYTLIHTIEKIYGRLY